MLGAFTTKLGMLTYYNKFASRQILQFVNNNKQPQAAYNLLVLGAFTTKVGTLMYYDKVLPKQKLQDNKQATKTCVFCLCL